MKRENGALNLKACRNLFLYKRLSLCEFCFLLVIKTMDNITDEERKVVDELRKRTINDLTPKLLEDETVFYRFSKARDFKLVDAEAMLRKHIAWRKEWKIDTILTDYEPLEVLRKYVASNFVCFDKEGCLVRITDFGRLDPKGVVNSATKMEVSKYSIFLTEEDRELVIKRGGNMQKPIFVGIFNFEGLTLATAVSLENLQYLAFYLKVVLENYPETVKTVIIINAPSYFNWIYSALRPILPASVTRNIHVFGKDGWKEVLLKEIDADELPACLGGNKTDPDGNPLCKTVIHRSQPILKKYYKGNREKRLILEPDALKIVVMPLSKKEITFEIKNDNSYLQWEIEVINRDIDFYLIYRGDSYEILEPEVLVPKQRIDALSDTEEGCIRCENLGYYTIVFDNSYSWFHSKELYYRAGKRSPNNSDLYNSR